MPLPASEAVTYAFGRSKAGWARKPALFCPVRHIFERVAPKLAIRRAAAAFRHMLTFFG
jgi:hypothetical protein